MRTATQPRNHQKAHQINVKPIPHHSIYLAPLGSLSLLTAQVISPPTHTKNIGSNHQASPIFDCTTGAGLATSAGLAQAVDVFSTMQKLEKLV